MSCPFPSRITAWCVPSSEGTTCARKVTSNGAFSKVCLSGQECRMETSKYPSSSAGPVDIALGKGIVGLFYAALTTAVALGLNAHLVMHWGLAIAAVIVLFLIRLVKRA